MSKWKDAREFGRWFVENGLPFNFPKDFQSISIDVCDTFLMYREGRFQVQFYIMKKGVITPAHCHPGVEVILAPWMPDQKEWWLEKEMTYDMDLHAGHLAFEEDTPVVAFSRWDEGVPMTNLVLHWTGELMDETHRQLLEDTWNVKIEDNYFDCRETVMMENYAAPE